MREVVRVIDLALEDCLIDTASDAFLPYAAPRIAEALRDARLLREPWTVLRPVVCRRCGHEPHSNGGDGCTAPRAVTPIAGPVVACGCRAVMAALRKAAQDYLDEQRARNARWGRHRRTP